MEPMLGVPEDDVVADAALQAAVRIEEMLVEFGPCVGLMANLATVGAAEGLDEAFDFLGHSADRLQGFELHAAPLRPMAFTEIP